MPVHLRPAGARVAERAAGLSRQRRAPAARRATGSRPAPSARVLSFTDWWGTRVDAFGVREPHLVLDVVAEATVETPPPAAAHRRPAGRRAGRPALPRPARRVPRAHAAHRLGRRPSPPRPQRQVELRRARRRLPGARPAPLRRRRSSTYAAGLHLRRRRRRRGLRARAPGVCQDFAHLGGRPVPVRRHPGPLRVRLPVHHRRRHRRRRRDADAVRVQTHAWFEAAIPGVGWLALDPTNGQEVGPRHVKIGHGRDYDDVPPLRGVFAGQADHDSTSRSRSAGSAPRRRSCPRPAPANGHHRARPLVAVPVVAVITAAADAGPRRAPAPAGRQPRAAAATTAAAVAVVGNAGK